MLALLAAPACGDGLVAYEPHEETVDVVLDALDPDTGPSMGGTDVLITGVGLQGTVRIWFDAREAEVTRIDGTTLVATTPAMPGPGTVDVRVTSDAGEGLSEDAFRFTGPGTGVTDEPSDETTDDPDPIDATGLTGGLIEMNHLQIACPECLGYGSGQTLVVSADAAFHNPKNGSWIDWLPPVGTCRLDAAPSALANNTYDVGSWVYLNSGARSIPLQRQQGQAGTIYVNDGLDDSDYLRNASWDVSIPDGGPLGPVSVDDAFVTGEGYDYIEPYLIAATFNYAFSAPISQYGQTFLWGPTGQDTFLIQLDVYDEWGVNFYGSVMCHGPDNGAMTIPSSYLSIFPSWGLVAVWMYRYQTSEFVLPNNGATIEAITWMGISGTAYMCPYQFAYCY